MAQTKQQIQAMLSEASTSPRHRFGQNFMIDRNLVALVAEAGEIGPEDVVIEVGPGTGTLTEELLARAGQVIAVEIDRDLAGLLRKSMAAHAHFRLIEGDALASKHQLNPELVTAIREALAAGKTVKLVANLPYNIASPLVIELLQEGVSRLAFTVQKEVGLRLKGAAGSDDYGPLTVMAQLLAEVKVERTLPAQAFWPAPKIESALVTMRRADQLGADAKAVGQFVAALFAARRKMLRKALQQAEVANIEAVCQSMGFTGEERPEVLTPGQILGLWRVVYGKAAVA